MTDCDRTTDVIYTTMNDLSDFGGIETKIPLEIEYLSKHGYAVRVFSRKPKRRLTRINKGAVLFEHYPESFEKYPWMLHDLLIVFYLALRIRQLSHRRRLVVVSFSAMDGLAGGLARLLGSKVKVILRICGPLSYEVLHFTPSKKTRYRVYSLLFRYVEFASYTLAHSILPVSEFEEKNVRSYGVSDSKVRIVRNGVETCRFENPSPPEDIRIPPDSGVVMFVGRFFEKNGILVVADSVRLVHKVLPNVLFILVGDGPLRGTVETRLANEIASGTVVLTGFRSDVPQLHTLADVYVGHLSSQVDGIGQTVLEAMVSGLPVIVGDDEISRGLIDHNRTGVLIPKDDSRALADAIVNLLGDDHLRSRIGTSAMTLSRRSHSFDAMMKNIIDAF